MVKRDLLAMAAKNLLRRKGRTFLTMLGVLIGTTSIVVMVSLGLGMQSAQQQMISQWGSLNEITVQQSYAFDESQEKNVVLNDDTLAGLQAMEGVQTVIPMVQVSASRASCGKLEGWLEIYGLEPELMADKGLTVEQGRLLEARDRTGLVLGGMVGQGFSDPNSQSADFQEESWEDYQNRVYDQTLALLDKKIVAEFMNPETEQTKRMTFQVVGVLPKENSSNGYSAYGSLQTLQQLQKLMLTSEEKKKKNRDLYNQITVVTTDVEATKTVLQSLKDQGYNAYSVAESLSGIEQSSRVTQLVLGGIGGITLLVAAIGIINTMVMSIYERTREIAIMKVIGATFQDIRLLFLAEAGMIGFFGGLLGLVFSYGLSFLINRLSGDFMGNYLGSGQALAISEIPLWLAAFAVLFSILIGVLAGVYPANRAVKLSPIEAMRNN